MDDFNNLTAILDVIVGVSFAKLVEYIAIKIYTKIDSLNKSFLDVD